jgi:hypothetical protein
MRQYIGHKVIKVKRISMVQLKRLNKLGFTVILC